MKQIKETWLRLRGETPTHFKRIIYGAITIGGMCGVVLALPITLPSIVVTILGYGVTAGVVAATIAKQAVKDPQEIIDKLTSKNEKA